MKYQANNTRLAKNTLMLYGRTIFTMIISLYTSRVILSALGVEDFGIYNVVGGMVAMFSIISGSLSTSISRYLTFELGNGDNEKLNKIFSTSINIQIAISIIILILGETIGLWFLRDMMNIPPDRINEATIVLHCSLATFIINLISVPYNATIVAHERMSAFAYISILDVILKLGIVFLLYVFPWDHLTVYSLLLVIESLIIRIIYGWYCNHNFAETKYRFSHDSKLVKEMFGFAGWGFLTNSAFMFNNQGINILMNLFFGVTVNAARGIAIQVETALVKFSADFTTAINPQIIKSYAANNMPNVYSLVNLGAKFSYYLIFIVALPVIMETEYILNLWLGIVPEHTATFVRLAIIGTMIDRLGYSGYTACMATGNIKKYTLCITSVGCLVFPISYIAFKLGAPAEASYIIFALIYIIVDIIRLWIMKGLINYPIMSFFKDVVVKIILSTALAIIAPIVIVWIVEPSFLRLIITVTTSLISAIIAIYALGLSPDERIKVTTKLFSLLKLQKHVNKESH